MRSAHDPAAPSKFRILIFFGLWFAFGAFGLNWASAHRSLVCDAPAPAAQCRIESIKLFSERHVATIPMRDIQEARTVDFQSGGKTTSSMSYLELRTRGEVIRLSNDHYSDLSMDIAADRINAHVAAKSGERLTLVAPFPNGFFAMAGVFAAMTAFFLGAFLLAARLNKNPKLIAELERVSVRK